MIFAALIIAAVLIWIINSTVLAEGAQQTTGTHETDRKLIEPDEPFHLVLKVRNASRFPVPYLRIDELIEPYMTAEEGEHIIHTKYSGIHATYSCRMRPKEEVTFLTPVSVSQRGRYVLRDFVYSTGDFLGLKEESHRTSKLTEFVIPPRELQSAVLDDAAGGFLGSVSVRRFIHEDPILTAGFREYTGREPMKSISWPHSTIQMMVKVPDYTAEPNVCVILNADSGSEERDELLETCYSMTRSICRMMEERRMHYAFCTNLIPDGVPYGKIRIPEGIGHEHFMSVLECLGRASGRTDSSFTQLIDDASHRSEFASGYIIITPSRRDAEYSPAFFRFSSMKNVRVISAEEVLS